MQSIKLILTLLLSGSVAKECPVNVLVQLPLVVEYALWRGWQQALIYAPDIEPGCQWAVLRLVKCLGVNGVASVLNSLNSARFSTRLGVAILSPRLKRNSTSTHSLTKLINKLSELQMNTASYDWLLAARTDQDFKSINEILNATAIRFDQNIVVSYSFSKYRFEVRSLGVCDTNFAYKDYRDSSSNDFNIKRYQYYKHRRYYNNNCRYGSHDQNCGKTEYERNYYRTTERFRNLTRSKMYKKSGTILPLSLTGIVTYDQSRKFEMTNISKFSLKLQYKKSNRMYHYPEVPEGSYLLQYFKIRINSTLYAYFLGVWNRDLSMSQMETPYPVEARNFLGAELTVGRCNSSSDGSPSLEDDGPSAPTSLDDVLHFLTVRLNITSLSRYYSKLGFRTYEGAWTGLLGGLMDASVDIALEPVTVHHPQHQDMDFIFPIAETMCNIYIRHQETSTVRDIFLAPFSGRLVACVIAISVVASLAIVVISRLTPSLADRPRSMGFTEGLIWSTGILCQQGGTWTPPSSAASVLLIVCLFFAVVTYNSYAAFITSVLSVRVASVDTVAAVLHSPNFKISYIRNGADQMYLMSTKDVQLNAFYIRGYSDAENLVSSAEEGLMRAARQDYAFFAGQRAARSTLRSMSQARGRCEVRELPVPSTRAHVAFPLPKRSPYARPILVSLLQLRSGGALARLEAALVPAMPQCAPSAGFASARAADVRSALILLLIGLIAALLLGIGEYSWKNRKGQRKFLVHCYRRLANLIHLLD